MKTIVIIGLGKFGFYLAKSLSRLDNKIIAIDTNERRVQEISAYIENAYILDSTNKSALEDAGISHVDLAIVSIGENIEASILTVMALKDLGNENIIAKAVSTIHGEILAKIGVTKVIHPEKVAGRVLLHNLIENLTVEKIDLSNSMRIIKFIVPRGLIAKRIDEIERSFKDIKIIAYKTDTKWIIHMDDHYKIQAKDTLSCIGDSKAVEAFYSSITQE